MNVNVLQLPKAAEMVQFGVGQFQEHNTCFLLFLFFFHHPVKHRHSLPGPLFQAHIPSVSWRRQLALEGSALDELASPIAR